MGSHSQKTESGNKLFGRKKGHALSARQQSLIETLLPVLSLSLPGDDSLPLEPASLFADAVKEVWFEVGFGKGEHLAEQARRHPEIGFIGCEPFINGTASLLSLIDEKGLGNIRIHSDDAWDVLARLPEASLGRFFLLHPDPWPKNRHAKRRFVNRETLGRLACLLMDEAELRIGTDHPVYCRWIMQEMNHCPDFDWIAETAADWRSPPSDWPTTRYGKKAKAEGRATAYLSFRRKAREGVAENA